MYYVPSVYNIFLILLHLLIFKQPKVSKKSYSFKCMPSNQRHLIHELAEFYGCQTESYDEEPNKNVVATAVKLVVFMLAASLPYLFFVLVRQVVYN